MAESYGTVEYEHVDTGDKRWTTRKKAQLIGLIAVIAFIAVLVTVLAVAFTVNNEPDNNGPDNPPTPEVPSLQGFMHIPRLMGHLFELQNFATANGNTRAVDTPGYNASVNYVVQMIQNNTNYNVVVQPFFVEMFVVVQPPKLSQASPEIINYAQGKDFNSMGGFSGLVSLNSTAVSVVAELGCFPGDYQNVIPQSIAIVSRGNCTFNHKILLAQAANASALLIYNQGDAPTPDRTDVFTGDAGQGVTIPVFALSYPLGSALIEIEGLTLNLYMNTKAYNATTYNVIADTLDGDQSSTIVIGSHLDSVPAGPGINDNGSGSSTNLELAIQLFQFLTQSSSKLVNRVRFAWWGAEERGLLGSTYYVKNLNSSELSKIAMNINLDMVGSPNYYRAIYNGSSAADISIRNGSTAIQYQFQNGFEYLLELSYDLSAFNGRSDYGPFIENGIPAGGLFTGAEVMKSVQQRTRYGGVANTPFDPCYHQSCDTVENINELVLLENAKNAAFALQSFAFTPNLTNYLDRKSVV